MIHKMVLHTTQMIGFSKGIKYDDVTVQIWHTWNSMLSMNSAIEFHGVSKYQWTGNISKRKSNTRYISFK